MMIYSQTAKRRKLSNLARVPGTNKHVNHPTVDVSVFKVLAYASTQEIFTCNNSKIASHLDAPQHQ